VLACSMSANGQRMITAGNDGTARVWDEQGKCLHILQGHQDWVLACSMSANGQRMITAGDDGTARVWDEQGKCLHILQGHQDWVLACSMSADGRRMMTLGGTVRFWNSDDLHTWKCALELHPQTQTLVWLDAQTRTLKLKGPDWPFWQLVGPGERPGDSVHAALGETIAAFGPMGHKQLANAEEWQFLPRDDIPPENAEAMRELGHRAV